MSIDPASINGMFVLGSRIHECDLPGELDERDHWPHLVLPPEDDEPLDLAKYMDHVLIAPIEYEKMAKLIQGLKVEYRTSIGVSTDAWSWAITTRTYNRLRYIEHIRRTCPLPTRKLRKCQMRKVYAYHKRARRMFGL